MLDYSPLVSYRDLMLLHHGLRGSPHTCGSLGLGLEGGFRLHWDRPVKFCLHQPGGEPGGA